MYDDKTKVFIGCTSKARAVELVEMVQQLMEALDPARTKAWFAGKFVFMTSSGSDIEDYQDHVHFDEDLCVYIMEDSRANPYLFMRLITKHLAKKPTMIVQTDDCLFGELEEALLFESPLLNWVVGRETFVKELLDFCLKATAE